jgi:hypothetical protein
LLINLAKDALDLRAPFWECNIRESIIKKQAKHFLFTLVLILSDLEEFVGLSKNINFRIAFKMTNLAALFKNYENNI